MSRVQDYTLPGESFQIPGYELGKKLNHGTKTSVFLAVQKNLRRKTAIKLLIPHRDWESSANERILNEALIAAQLTHPHIITIYDIGNFASCNYFTMGYLSGGNLRQRIGQGMTVRDVLNILKQVACALEFAHRQGVIHCNIRPDNILLDHHNNAVISNFGNAKSMLTSDRVYSSHDPKNVSAYMSPEQVRGAQIDGCTDIYSLGVILFELITGHVPFAANESSEMLYKQLTENVPQLDKRYYMFQPLLEKMLDKTQQQRMQNGTELIHAIEAMERQLWLNAFKQNKKNENSITHTADQQTNPVQTKTRYKTNSIVDEKNHRYVVPGTKISHDATLIPKLVDDHKNLTVLFAKLVASIDQADFNQIKQHCGNFLNLFNAHVLLEYTKLYIFLEFVFSEEDENRLIVREFRSEMNSIGKAVRGFFKKWDAGLLNTQTLPMFKEALLRIGDILIERIKTEEELLYEIYRQVPQLNK